MPDGESDIGHCRDKRFVLVDAKATSGGELVEPHERQRDPRDGDSSVEQDGIGIRREGRRGRPHPDGEAQRAGDAAP